MHSSTCNNAVYKAVGAGRTDRNCSSALAWWTIVFSFFELFLSQIKDFHSLWWALTPQLGLNAHSCFLSEHNTMRSTQKEWVTTTPAAL